jgi:hypothetical protein
MAWTRAHPWQWLAGYLVVTAALYQTAIRLPWTEGFGIEPTSWDAYIPLLPWTAAPYLTYFALMPSWVVLVRRRPDSARLLWAAGLCVLGNLAINVCVPTYLVDPLTPADAEAAGALLGLVVGSDRPYAALPSGHLALPLALAWLQHRAAVRHGWIYLPWTLVMGLSILTTKQHYLPDALGALVWGTLAPLLALAVLRPPLDKGFSISDPTR